MESDPKKYDNESYQEAVDLIHEQAPVEPEASREDKAPESQTTSIEIAPEPIDIDKSEDEDGDEDEDA